MKPILDYINTEHVTTCNPEGDLGISIELSQMTERLALYLSQPNVKDIKPSEYRAAAIILENYEAIRAISEMIGISLSKYDIANLKNIASNIISNMARTLYKETENKLTNKRQYGGDKYSLPEFIIEHEVYLFRRGKAGEAIIIFHPDYAHMTTTNYCDFNITDNFFYGKCSIVKGIEAINALLAIRSIYQVYFDNPSNYSVEGEDEIFEDIDSLIFNIIKAALLSSIKNKSESEEVAR